MNLKKIIAKFSLYKKISFWINQTNLDRFFQNLLIRKNDKNKNNNKAI